MGNSVNFAILPFNFLTFETLFLKKNTLNTYYSIQYLKENNKITE